MVDVVVVVVVDDNDDRLDDLTTRTPYLSAKLSQDAMSTTPCLSSLGYLLLEMPKIEENYILFPHSMIPSKKYRILSET